MKEVFLYYSIVLGVAADDDGDSCLQESRMQSSAAVTSRSQYCQLTLHVVVVVAAAAGAGFDECLLQLRH